MRLGLRTFGFLCGLLAAGMCVAVLKPGLIREATQAAELRPYAFVMAAILLRRRDPRHDPAAGGGGRARRRHRDDGDIRLPDGRPPPGDADHRRAQHEGPGAGGPGHRPAGRTGLLLPRVLPRLHVLLRDARWGSWTTPTSWSSQFLGPRRAEGPVHRRRRVPPAMGRAREDLRRGAEFGTRRSFSRTPRSTTMSWPPAPTTIYSATSLEHSVSDLRMTPAMPPPATAKPRAGRPAVSCRSPGRRSTRRRSPAWPRCCAPGGSPPGPR